MGLALAGIGGLFIFIGWIWLVITGFTKGGVLWGILTFFFSWIGGLAFYFVKKEGLTPTMVILGGLALVIVGQVIGR